jgi:hypothetical protein
MSQRDREPEQVRGGGVVIYLAQSPLSRSDLGDVLGRVRGMGARIGDVRILE